MCAREIKGIVYYLDNSENVYNPEEIQMGSNPASKIGKYHKEKEVYIIELFE